ncbi:MAG: hypothetical protein D6690_00015 [Nitrospirae bacterium]|nr:MAG: hypothetical protein D6690_00015 [Nitrospirota bacterium]
MAKAKSKTSKSARKINKGKQIQRPDSQALQAAQAERAGLNFEWHYGRITRLGFYEPGGRAISIIWEEGGVTSQQGGISDEAWEIFKLAFRTTGRIAILSDEPKDQWGYDYRFLEAMA